MTEFSITWEDAMATIVHLISIIGYYLDGSSKKRPKLGVATCASFTLPPATRKSDSDDNDNEPSEQSCEFYLTWHMPRVHFRSALVAYKRYALFICFRVYL